MNIEELLHSISTVNKEINTKEISKKGKFPVVSQGSELIDGYYNDENKVIYQNPVILFGDHTRIVKFIDFPFIPGANGTKIFYTDYEPKYIFYLVLYASYKIENRGYGRHCSLLKKYKVLFTEDLEVQKKISYLITSAFKQLEKLKEQLI